MRTDKSSSRVSAKLLYKTPDNQPYDVAVLRVNPRDVDPSLEAVQLSRAPILKGEQSIVFPNCIASLFSYNIFALSRDNARSSSTFIIYARLYYLLQQSLSCTIWDLLRDIQCVKLMCRIAEIPETGTSDGAKISDGIIIRYACALAAYSSCFVSKHYLENWRT